MRNQSIQSIRLTIRAHHRTYQFHVVEPILVRPTERVHDDEAAAGPPSPPPAPSQPSSDPSRPSRQLPRRNGRRGRGHRRRDHRCGLGNDHRADADQGDGEILPLTSVDTMKEREEMRDLDVWCCAAVPV